MMNRWLPVSLAVALLACPTIARAASIQINSAGQLTGSVVFVDFETSLPSGLGTTGSFSADCNAHNSCVPGNDGVVTFPPTVLTFLFGSPVFGVGLTFGNDDPTFLPSGAFGVLSIRSGSTNLGSVSVLANRNDLPDQFIGLISDVGFTHADFSYSTGTAATWVDNLFYQTTPAAITATPEPASLLLLSTGIVTLVARRRKEKLRR